ncbi:quinone-dependent dihydroorotate dehydrogenase [Candidatus Chloroploca asiatica]
MYQYVLRPALFRLYRGDAEGAHERTLALLAMVARRRMLLHLMRRLYADQPPSLARTLFGVRFPNPVGLAAGMDKDGVALPAWDALGFGFVEIGTVTHQAQPGNPRPRLFRLIKDEAIINRMGFNNHGADALALRLKQVGTLSIPLGISIGKSKQTPLEHAIEDYVASFTTLFPYASYVAVNVSSPNTPGLRSLQDRAQLDALLATLTDENRQLAAREASQPRPILVKIAPDLSESALGEVLDVCTTHAISGVIATNTTLSREGLSEQDASLRGETGGLSGRPLAAKALAVVRFIARETGGALPIIGVGGIACGEDALRMLEAGASLVQVYTGLVYQGPGLPRQIKQTLARRV